MKDRKPQPAWFFWYYAGYTLLTMLGFAYLAFDFVTHPFAPDYTYGSVAYRLTTALVIAPLSLVISITVLRRRPRNVIGLFLLSWTAVIMMGTLRADSPISVDVFNYCYQSIWLIPLFFPDGQPFPQRYQRAIRCFAALSTLSFCVFSTISPTVSLIQYGATVGVAANPLFIAGLAPFADVLTAIQLLLWLPTVFFMIPSLVGHYLSGDTRIRQQIKWFIWVYAIMLVLFAAKIIGLEEKRSFLAFIDGELFQIAPFVTIAYVILRHRLYDIDIIIRRTLIYSILTAVLAAIYFGGVVLAQQVFRLASGESSDPAIVASTLLIAALFTPLRRRIQQLIDRRFYRRKYDAERTLARFNQTLRDEVDVETLKSHLVDVVQDTMQPDRMALWIPSPKESQS
ncbi:MAG: hypothetical protein GC204_12950 [Chloroflexi bacterium]|nr:hypothetical protein [Chloroflexota bacterium]